MNTTHPVCTCKENYLCTNCIRIMLAKRLRQEEAPDVVYLQEEDKEYKMCGICRSLMTEYEHSWHCPKGHIYAKCIRVNKL